jgi:hypothetical protein
VVAVVELLAEAELVKMMEVLQVEVGLVHLLKLQEVLFLMLAVVEAVEKHTQKALQVLAEQVELVDKIQVVLQLLVVVQLIEVVAAVVEHLRELVVQV